jgi:hypothetical protein
MRSFLVRPKVALFAAALVVPAVASGACASRTACIAYTQAEYDANNGCLAPKDALGAFTSPTCPGSVVSVDGPGTFDGEICCYPVTYDKVDQSCNNGNGNSGSGFAGGGTTFGPPTPTTTGTFPSTGTCAPTCSTAIDAGLPLCGSTLANEALNQLQICAGCFESPSGSNCVSQCSSFCVGGAVDPVCDSCLANVCGDALTSCRSN